MKVKIIKPENDWIPPTPLGESVLFIMSKPWEVGKPNSIYVLRCHKCGLAANLGDHEVSVEGENITINPSILCPREHPETCGAHYYIKNSEIVN